MCYSYFIVSFQIDSVNSLVTSGQLCRKHCVAGGNRKFIPSDNRKSHPEIKTHLTLLSIARAEHSSSSVVCYHSRSSQLLTQRPLEQSHRHVKQSHGQRDPLVQSHSVTLNSAHDSCKQQCVYSLASRTRPVARQSVCRSDIFFSKSALPSAGYSTLTGHLDTAAPGRPAVFVNTDWNTNDLIVCFYFTRYAVELPVSVIL